RGLDEQPRTQRKPHQLRPARQSEAILQTRTVLVHRFRAERQFLADFLGAVSQGEQGEDFALATAQPFRRRFFVVDLARLAIALQHHQTGRVLVEKEPVARYGADRARQLFHRRVLPQEPAGDRCRRRRTPDTSPRERGSAVSDSKIYTSREGWRPLDRIAVLLRPRDTKTGA